MHLPLLLFGICSPGIVSKGSGIERAYKIQVQRVRDSSVDGPEGKTVAGSRVVY